MYSNSPFENSPTAFWIPLGTLGMKQRARDTRCLSLQSLQSHEEIDTRLPPTHPDRSSERTVQETAGQARRWEDDLIWDQKQGHGERLFNDANAYLMTQDTPHVEQTKSTQQFVQFSAALEFLKRIIVEVWNWDVFPKAHMLEV